MPDTSSAAVRLKIPVRSVQLVTETSWAEVLDLSQEDPQGKTVYHSQSSSKLVV